jgi:hypothetical protein
MDLPPSPSSAPEPCQWAGAGLGSAACGLAGRVLCVVATCVFAAGACPARVFRQEESLVTELN